MVVPINKVCDHVFPWQGIDLQNIIIITVRSLASVALRKALHSRVGYHFDFFSLDLNDELSGLNGAVLNEQTSFLNHSLYQIINLYNRKKPNAPRSVILIGHSMVTAI